MEKIDLNKILRSRVPHGNMIPGFLISTLERLVRQDELNDALDATAPAEGTAFAEALYDYLDIHLNVEGLENIPREGRYIFASNHPLGGLDGIGLIKILGGIYGDENIKFLVNDMLMAVEPLRPVFLPINKFGAQGRAAAASIARAYEGTGQIIIFPAGLCSRADGKNRIADLEWQKSFISKAIEYHRDIIPIRFEGVNRHRFYNTSKWRTRLGVKFNIEQVLLPAELLAAKGKTFSVRFFKPIVWEKLRDSGYTPTQLAAIIRHLVHNPDSPLLIPPL